MKRHSHHYYLLVLTLSLLCLTSCSGGSGGIAQGDSTDPVGSLTAQMEVTVKKAEYSTFLTDQGYSVAVSSATVTMSNLLAGEDSENSHSIRTTCSHRHEETTTETAIGSRLQGQWTVSLFSGDAVLGVAQANPGTYDSFSFSIAPQGDSPSIALQGTVSINGTAFPLSASLPISDRVTKDDLSITFQYGHYLPIHIGFHVHEWLNGIDFKTLTVTEGTILINGSVNAEACATMKNNIESTVHVHPGSLSGSRGDFMAAFSFQPYQHFITGRF